ncbi:MAG: Ig-like domain-containing protein, partial [Brevinematia bacterium]
MKKSFFIYIVLVGIAIHCMVSCTRLVDLLPKGNQTNQPPKPTISINHPTNNQILTTNYTKVEGTAFCEEGIKEVKLRLGSSGEFGTVDGTTNWSTNLSNLPEGINTIFVFAVSENNVTSTTSSITFIVDTPPTLSILTPTNNQIITTSSVSVQGNANDTLGIKEVRLRLGSSGEFGTVDGTINWSTNLSNLPEGTNTIFVFAVSSNDISSAINSVYFIIDLTPPDISITNPTNNQVVTTNSITVYGIASDNLSLKEVWLRLGPAGDYGKVSGTTSWSSNLSNLEEGTNYIYAFAVDEAGLTNYTTNTIVVVLNVYVSTTGNDNNLGILKNSPVRSIPKGIEVANQYGVKNILVSVGEYTPGNGLLPTGSKSGIILTNSHLRLIGGWNTDFNSRIGRSLLDGKKLLYHIIYSTNTYGVLIDGFTITGGLANGSGEDGIGGGLFLSNVISSVISNCVITSNSSKDLGGGLLLFYSHSNTIVSNIFTYNTNNFQGGAIFLEGANYNVIANTIISNRSLEGGGIYINSSHSNHIKSVVSSNHSSGTGGGIYLFFSDFNLIEGIVGFNTAQAGGGLYIESSHNNTMSNLVVISNTTTSDNAGGGIFL